MTRSRLACCTAVVTALLVVAGCTSRTIAPAPGGVKKAPDANAMLSTPYTAEQIRDANPPGTRLVFRIQASGAADMLQTLHWIGGDETTSLEGGMAPADGSVPPEMQIAEASWTELRDHAAFPAAGTVRGESTCTVEAGSFDCMRYVVTDAGTEPPTVSHFYFARDRPGPPVLLVSEQAGETVYRMELIEDSRD